MPGKQFTGSTKPYLSIVDGSLRQVVDKDTEGAKKREWGLPNGDSGVKWELIYSEWESTLREIKIETKDYGEGRKVSMALFVFDDVHVQMPTDSRYFSDFACKLLACDLSKPIIIHPYDFEVDGKRKKGVSVVQGEDKIGNFFWKDGVLSPEFPQVDEDKKERPNYWKTYFSEVEWFLVEKLQNLKFPEKPDSYTQGQDLVKDLKNHELGQDLPF